MLFISQCHQLVYRSQLQEKDQHGLMGIKAALAPTVLPQAMKANCTGSCVSWSASDCSSLLGI